MEASALYIHSATFTCALLLVTLSVSTGAFYDLVLVAATDHHDCLSVMISSIDAASSSHSWVGQWHRFHFSRCVWVSLSGTMSVSGANFHSSCRWSSITIPIRTVPSQWLIGICSCHRRLPRDCLVGNICSVAMGVALWVPLVVWVLPLVILLSVPLACISTIGVSYCTWFNMSILVISSGSSLCTPCLRFNHCGHDM